MRLWLWVFALAACGDDGGGGQGKEGDTDVDADTDSDADADADTDTEPVPVPLECAEAACDGDPTGNWTMLGECIDDPRFADTESRCAGNSVTLYAVGVDGTMNFTASDYIWYVAGGSTGIEVIVPPECNEGCLTYEMEDLGVRCTTTGKGGCMCTGSRYSSTWLDSGTWTRTGGDLLLQSAATGGSRTIEVCATGTNIWFYDPNRDVSITGIPTP